MSSSVIEKPADPPVVQRARLPRLETLLSAKGPLAKSLPGFAHRSQQVEMAKAVQAALEEGRPCLAEAGTGTGKTLAYLVPLAMWLHRHGGRAVLSTHTLALQSQLIERDIPTLLAALPELEIEAAALKGRSNFLCLQDLQIAGSDLMAAADPAFARIQRWSNETDTGDVSELDFKYDGWQEIAANPDTCRQRECRFYDRCFYFKARKNAEKCQLLVVNHALFFADLRLRMQTPNGPTIIPEYNAVVFDEAHHIDDTATRAFGVEWGSRRVPQLVYRARKLASDGLIESAHLSGLEALNQALLDPFLSAQRPEDFTDDLLRGDDDRADFYEKRDALCMSLDALAKDLVTAVDGAQDPMTREKAGGLARTATRVSSELRQVTQPDSSDETFRWYQARRLKGGSAVAQLVKTPLEIAPTLQKALLTATPRVILTSATLASGGKFEFLKKRLGIGIAPGPSPAPQERGEGFGDGATNGSTGTPLSCGAGEGLGVGVGATPKPLLAAPPPPIELIVGSPFDYGSNCLLYVPRHLTAPSSDFEYLRSVITEILTLIEIAGGRTFLLFTSHRMLREVHEQLWDKTDFPIFAQGDMPAGRLTEEFIKAKNGILLGAASFWEGVDVPGAALSMVIIDKLPFATPDAPTEKAREKAIREAGGDPFREYSLPKAQIRLKQGFGRLLRTITDRGAVAILDSRLYTKSYGREFLRDLPPCPRTDAIESVARFFADEPETTT